MEAEHWQKVERLYHAALAVEESRRDDFLEDSCAGDEPLRNEVETLLACHGKAEQFMEVPALEAMAKVLASEEGQPSPTAEARADYQDFFNLWKDADPDITIFQEARAEYATLN